VRVICARPYHALFMHNMLIRPTEEELAEFGEPDYVIFNAGSSRPTATPGHDLQAPASTCSSATARSSSSAPSTPAR
jgi:ATP-dependent phosphoenolpyruvate carboxykinase